MEYIQRDSEEKGNISYTFLIVCITDDKIAIVKNLCLTR